MGGRREGEERREERGEGLGQRSSDTSTSKISDKPAPNLRQPTHSLLQQVAEPPIACEVVPVVPVRPILVCLIGTEKSACRRTLTWVT